MLDLRNITETRKPGSAFRTVYDATVGSDCLKCGKCCKMIKLIFFSRLEPQYAELKTLLNSSPKNLPGVISYVEENERGILVSAKSHEGCHFLEADNKCSVYPLRPAVCREYPFVPIEREIIRSDGIKDKIPLIFISSDCPPINDIKKSGYKFLFLEDMIAEVGKIKENPEIYGFHPKHYFLEQLNNMKTDGVILTKLLGSSLRALNDDMKKRIYGDLDVILRTPDGHAIFPIS